MRLPIFNQGALPVGPHRLDPVDELALSTATIGPYSVTADDFVLAVDDGVLFIPLDQSGAVAELAQYRGSLTRAACRPHATWHQSQGPGPLR